MACLTWFKLAQRRAGSPRSTWARSHTVIGGKMYGSKAPRMQSDEDQPPFRVYSAGNWPEHRLTASGTSAQLLPSPSTAAEMLSTPRPTIPLPQRCHGRRSTGRDSKWLRVRVRAKRTATHQEALDGCDQLDSSGRGERHTRWPSSPTHSLAFCGVALTVLVDHSSPFQCHQRAHRKLSRCRLDLYQNHNQRGRPEAHPNYRQWIWDQQVRLASSMYSLCDLQAGQVLRLAELDDVRL